MPKRGNWVDTPQGRGRVCDRNLLTRKVSVQLETGSVAHFLCSEITIYTPEPRPRIGSDRQQPRNGGNSNRDRGPRRDRGERPREDEPPRNEVPPEKETVPEKEDSTPQGA